jgi:endonuclease-8
MPEGDTVFHMASVLRDALLGAAVRHSDFRVPKLATVDLSGYQVTGSLSRGKHLLLRFAGPRELTLRSHLRMDGFWRVYPPAVRQPRNVRAHEIRVILRCDRATGVGVLLQDLDLVPTAQEESLVGHLGPDLLGPDWDPDEAVLRLSAQPDRPLAEALLDQRNLAGIGNVYKSELCFLRGHLPLTPVGEVADLPALVDLAHRLLTANRTRVRTTTGSTRRGETTYVYGRRAEPCRRCGTPIQRDGDGERVTYWCPTCQS